MELLISICERRQIPYEKKALSYIAVQNSCIPRDSIDALQEVYIQKGQIIYKETVEVLRGVDEGLIFDFYKKLIERDTIGFIGLIHSIKTTISIEKFVEALVSFTERGIYILNGCNVDGLNPEELVKYKDLFSSFSMQEICVLLRKMQELQNGVGLDTQLLKIGYLGLNDAVQVDEKVSAE